MSAKLDDLHVQALKRRLPRTGDSATVGYATRAVRILDQVNIFHHYNGIAVIGDFDVYVSNAGWHSSTTRERINEILLDNHIPFYVAQRQGRQILFARSNNARIIEGFTEAHFTMVAGVWEVV